MFCAVALIKRFPRHIDVFDYRIPEDLTVAVGSFVHVPLRGRITIALVVEVKPRTEVKRVRDIAGLADMPALTAEDVHFYRSVARRTYQSLGTILYTAIPLKPQRKLNYTAPDVVSRSLRISKDHVDALKMAVKAISETEHLVAAVPSDAFALMCVAGLVKRTQEPLLVLCPDLTLAQTLHEGLRSITQNIALYSGKMNKTHAYGTWQAIREGTVRVVISTLVGALVPPHPSTRIVVIGCGEDDFFQTDQNPHYDARWCLLSRRGTHKNPVAFLGTLPRLEEGMATFDWWKTPHVEIVDLSSASKLGSHYLLSPLVEDQLRALDLQSCLAVCYYNRLGEARVVQCGDCGYLISCKTCSRPYSTMQGQLACLTCQTHTPIPSVCQKCQSHAVSTKGMGNRGIAAMLRKRFPDVDIHIVEAKDPLPHKGIAIITRTVFYKPLRTVRIGAMIMLNADHDLFYHGFRSMEQAARLYRRFATQTSAPCFIQTWSPEIVREALGSTVAWQEKEEALRRLLRYPPHGDIVNVTARQDHEPLALFAGQYQNAELVHGTLSIKSPSEHQMLELLTFPNSCDIVVNR